MSQDLYTVLQVNFDDQEADSTFSTEEKCSSTTSFASCSILQSILIHISYPTYSAVLAAAIFELSAFINGSMKANKHTDQSLKMLKKLKSLIGFSGKSKRRLNLLTRTLIPVLWLFPVISVWVQISTFRKDRLKSARLINGAQNFLLRVTLHCCIVLLKVSEELGVWDSETDIKGQREKGVAFIWSAGLLNRCRCSHKICNSKTSVYGYRHYKLLLSVSSCIFICNTILASTSSQTLHCSRCFDGWKKEGAWIYFHYSLQIEFCHSYIFISAQTNFSRLQLRNNSSAFPHRLKGCLFGLPR